MQIIEIDEYSDFAIILQDHIGVYFKIDKCQMTLYINNEIILINGKILFALWIETQQNFI